MATSVCKARLSPDVTAMSAREPRIFSNAEGRSFAFTFCLVSTLFFLWGFCNGMIDIMDKHFQEELHLSLAQSAWVQFAHYLGYFVMALPAGALALKLGYKGGLIAGLLIVAAGGLWFLAATRIESFWAFLLGVGLIASGLTCLETIANPYAASLGSPSFAAVRINLAQSCNGVGWILGPIAGSLFFYSVDAHGRSTGSEQLYIPYLAVALVVLVLAGVFFWMDLPDPEVAARPPEARSSPSSPAGSLWSHPHFSMAVVAQFLYVAAQAGIFSFFINYMTSQVPPIPPRWNLGMADLAQQAGFLQGWLSGWFRMDGAGLLAISNKGAANLASLALLCFLMGRLTGAALLRKVSAHRLLMLFGLINAALALGIVAKLGWPSLACVFLSYFFMSIMFPTIFALGIHGLGPQTKRASAFLVMAIIGGAVVPKLMGYVADQTDLSRSFLVPMSCFAFVAYYGFQWPRYARPLTARD
jgi:MFS transporter, FHS family, L-fucose permease